MIHPNNIKEHKKSSYNSMYYNFLKVKIAILIINMKKELSNYEEINYYFYYLSIDIITN